MKLELCILIIFLRYIYARTSLRLVALTEAEQPEAVGLLGDIIQDIELKLTGIDISEDVLLLNRSNEDESYNKLCGSISQGISLMMDFTWTDWKLSNLLMDQWCVPYTRIEVGSAILIIQPLLDLLKAKNASDVVFIFQNENDLDQSLYNIISKTVLRVLVINGQFENRIVALKDLRPMPGHFSIIGKTTFIQDIYKMAKKNGIVQQSDRWIMAFTDLEHDRLDTSILEPSSTLLSITKSVGCKLIEMEDNCNLERDFNIQFPILTKIVEQVITALVETVKRHPYEPIKVMCDQDGSSLENYTNTLYRDTFMNTMQKYAISETSLFFWDRDRKTILLRGSYEVQEANKTFAKTIAKWKLGEPFRTNYGVKLQPIRRFLRIGTTPSIPWTYPKLDPVTGNRMMTSKGQPIYEGYCIDLIERMAEILDFDYEIITPKEGTFGKKYPNGTWNGIIGDLVRGDTDMAVAATMMTSEREEVIDFVAPYFQETGISIVIRKPVAKTSLFRFMTVLRLEVWLSIIAALTLTAILLSLLDRFSPYSARNNKSLYPYPCREFTLKECFWFALTSFTPQGGGESPKSLSGRTLVAAYWLFVVLMLSTFTANLAAFLTVERMATPVSSLEQLARQSRINYTVVQGSPTHAYFINMKNAEDTLYRIWKEITLNSTSDETIYQVWDYPIKEQYGRILLAINASEPALDAQEGFQRVNDHVDADFAFIHDSSVIKYEVCRNCNITEIGEVFGVRPYAVAVQQGSRLQEELSRTILQLQTERFFESLSEKYWNSSIRGICSDEDEAEGISLQSLGGVFIATLCGLALAMITLVWEIIYYKKKDRKISAESKIKNKWKIEKTFSQLSQKKIKKRGSSDLVKRSITFGDTFKPVLEKSKSKVSYINVDPKIAWNP